MDFARVAPGQLEQVDFTLPPDPAVNSNVLNGRRVADPKVYIGCPRWSVKEWIGKVYPKGTKDAQFLTHYLKQFNCIELNSTFYNLYAPAAIGRWADQAKGQDFKFCPKVFQGISHDAPLDNKPELVASFLESMRPFGAHLGPCFLQLSEAFAPARKQELFQFVAALPSDFNLFVELRHPAWFGNGELESVNGFLSQHNKGLLITDVSGRRDVCHMHLAQPSTFVRFVSNNGHPTDFARLDDWAERLGIWIERGLKEVYFIVHTSDEIKAPDLITYFIELLNQKIGLKLRQPLLQKDLFG